MGTKEEAERICSEREQNVCRPWGGPYKKTISCNRRIGRFRKGYTS